MNAIAEDESTQSQKMKPRHEDPIVTHAAYPLPQLNFPATQSQRLFKSAGLESKLFETS